MADTITLPPLDEAIVTAAHRELVRADAYKVATAEQFTVAGEELKRIKGKAFELENERVNMKAPALEACRRIDAFFKKPLDFLKSAETAIKRAMVRYSDEQDRIRAEDQRKADAAAAAERARLQEIAERAAAKGQEKKAELFEERAQAVVAPVIHRDTPKVAGISMRETWKFEVLNEDLVPREYLSVDESKIRRVVQALKAGTRIPGVRVYPEKSPAAAAGVA